MRALDPLFRTAYRVGFRAARLAWRVRRPHHVGALVALWVDERVLAVRQSYQAHWTLPGGGVDPGEGALAAAARELAEETGVRLPASSLKPAMVVEHVWNFRFDRVHVFEARLPGLPEVRLDGRELVEARWVTVEELLGLPLAPHVRDYAQGKSVVISQGDSADARR